MNILWIITASLLGFNIAMIFAGLLKLERNRYLMIYIPAVALFFVFFITSYDIKIRDLLLYNWYWGLAGAIIAGAFAMKNVFSQPPSPRSTGYGLFADIVWPGFLYGLMDSLLLSVLPVLTIKLMLSDGFWINTLSGRIASGVIALFASLFVTTVYHIGYPEYRGKNIIYPNVGNGIFTLAYILTMNPLAAILPHIAMHIAAMVHGRETTGQVPPHYMD